MKNNDPIDWTFSAAPAPGEEPPAGSSPAQPRPPRRHLSRGVWIALVALPAIVALLFAVIFPRVETLRARAAVSSVINRQEQARLAGDWAALQNDYAADTTGWAAHQIALLQYRQWPLPISLPGAQPEWQAGQLSQFQLLAPQLAQADMLRPFILADGTPVQFATPQFYRFAGGVWQQVAPPAAAPDQARVQHGAWVDVTYYPADAELAASLAHDLDALLSRACADWACPAGLRVALRFDATDNPALPPPQMFQPMLGSLTFQFIVANQSALPLQEIVLPTRLAGGYAADAPARAAVGRSAGLQALLSVAEQLAAHTTGRGENSLRDALVVREAARLGLEPQRLAELQIANPLYRPNELWFIDPSNGSNVAVLPQALAVLNRVLLNHSPAEEGQLLRTVDATSADPAAWLAAGLGLEPEGASAQLSQAALAAMPFPAVQPSGFAADLALTCPQGPVLASLSGQLAPLFADGFPGSSVDAWSPDGQRLALSVSGRQGVANLASGVGAWLPDPVHPAASAPAWVTPTIVVYPQPQRNLSNQVMYSNEAGLSLFDAATGHVVGAIPRFDSYLLSPSQSQAAVVANPSGDLSLLAVVPAQGGPALNLDTHAYNPAWSPDGHHLAYALRGSLDFTLVVADPAAGVKTNLLSKRHAGVPPAPDNANFYLIPAWSPSGDQLAVTTLVLSVQNTTGWVGVLAADGNSFHALPASPTQGVPYTANFSADGRYLAVGNYEVGGQVSVTVFSAAGSLLNTYPREGFVQWSPTGHTLAMLNASGLQLLAEPETVGAAPTAIGPADCTGLVWRPQ